MNAPDIPFATTSHSPLALPPLMDRFGRVHTSIRVSVTDRCNIRCQYCMPDSNVQFMSSHLLLSFETITRVVRVLARLGIRKIRLTGGEPLVRPQLHELVKSLKGIQGIHEIALTTNGMLLADQAFQLKHAGMDRVNISLDTLREETFRTMARRGGLDQVLEGINAALAADIPVRLNALILRQINWDDAIPLVEFARRLAIPIRFIEFMPLDADRRWSVDQVVSGDALRKHLTEHFGPMEKIPNVDPSQPSRDYQFSDGCGTIGFIDSVTQPFCSSCNRLRLQADGKIRNCLFGREEWDLKELAQVHPSDDNMLISRIRECIGQKHFSHGISDSGFVPPERAMYQIGG